MLSKAKIKEIKSLEKKKFRDERNLFIAEGNKIVADMLRVFDCELLIARTSWEKAYNSFINNEIIIANDDEMQKVCLMKTPQDVLAVFRKPSYQISSIDSRQLMLAIDGVQDPGNLGTIVRIADWFGINDIICSHDSADVFSPKAVQATMGALSHVRVHYSDIPSFLAKQTNIPIYGTFLDGDNIYDQNLTQNGIIVMGNEGNGIRSETSSCITNKLLIPPYPSRHETTESLNVAIATAIVCAEFRRRRRML